MSLTHRGYEARCEQCGAQVTVDAEDLCAAEDNLFAAGWSLIELVWYCKRCGLGTMAHAHREAEKQYAATRTDRMRAALAEGGVELQTLEELSEQEAAR